MTDKQVEDRLAQIKKQYFSGDAKKYEQQLKDQGLTDEQVRADIRAQLVSEKIFNAVTKDVKVSDADVEAFYAKNAQQFSTPESREVRHILVKTKAQAEALAAQLKAGGDFAKLAKQYSTDTGSKQTGGKLTITRGQTVAPFDKAAFALAANEVSGPVKTEFGYHLIEPLSAVKKASKAPLAEVEGFDPAAAAADEEERGDDGLGRWGEEGVRRQGLLRDRLQPAPRRHRHDLHVDGRRRRVTRRRAPLTRWARRSSSSRS